jgi:hypothetical protein
MTNTSRCTRQVSHSKLLDIGSISTAGPMRELAVTNLTHP